MLIEWKAYHMPSCNLHLWRMSGNVLNTILNSLLIILLFPFLTFYQETLQLYHLHFRENKYHLTLSESKSSIYKIICSWQFYYTVLSNAYLHVLLTLTFFVHVFYVHIFEVIPGVDSGCHYRVDSFPQLKFSYKHHKSLINTTPFFVKYMSSEMATGCILWTIINP